MCRCTSAGSVDSVLGLAPVSLVVREAREGSCSVFSAGAVLCLGDGGGEDSGDCEAPMLGDV
jgi:hypothetical protein